MKWKDLTGVIGSAAPIVGGLFGGPAGAAVGTIVSQALGVANEPDAIAKAVAADPQAALKLAQIERDHETELRNLTLEAEKARLADVQNARAREVSLAQSGHSNKPLYYLATTVVVGFFVTLGGMCWASATGQATDIPQGAFILFGSLSTGFGQVLAYFFGSSKGSADKTALLAGTPRG